MNRSWSLSLVCLVGLFLVSPLFAASPKDGKQKTKLKLTIAVLTFQAREPGNPSLGQDVSELLTAVLSGHETFELVDRQSLNQTLSESELSLTGLVSEDQAIKVGKIVGAQLMVSGRVFSLGKNLFIVAKLIGTETTLVESVKVQGNAKDDLGELAVALGDNVVQQIERSGERLAGVNITKPDPLPALLAKMEKAKKKPTVAVLILERHIPGPQPLARPIDPAVETEVKKILIDAGCVLKDIPGNELAEWVKEQKEKGQATWPQSLEGVDLVVTGEAFSQFAARIQSLVSCTARAEINVISRAEGKIVHADRTTTRAIDLAEHISGKTALQKAGRELGIGILEHVAGQR